MIREWLIKQRKKAKLSQHATALKMDFTDMRYMLIEHGKRQIDMNLSTVLKLAVVFGLSVDEVIKNEKSYLRTLQRKEKANAKKEAAAAAGQN